MNYRTAFGKLVLFLILMITAGTGQAVMLDQSQESWHGGSIGLSLTHPSLAQTFTAGITGQLDHVDLRFGEYGDDPSYPATISIINVVDGGRPEGSVLGSVNVPNIINGWNTINFLSESIFLSADTQYGILIFVDDPVYDTGLEVNAKTEWNDVYAGGIWWRKFGDTWYQNNNGDAEAVFRTYMVPEPTTVLLLGLGGLFLRKRKNRWKKA